MEGVQNGIISSIVWHERKAFKNVFDLRICQKKYASMQNCLNSEKK